MLNPPTLLFAKKYAFHTYEGITLLYSSYLFADARVTDFPGTDFPGGMELRA